MDCLHEQYSKESELDKMEVISMISKEESSNHEISFGRLGGFFENGMRWKDYIDTVLPEKRLYAEAFRKFAVSNNIRITGEQHQESSEAVPLFSDGTIMSLSWRAWGDIMAAIWSEEENKDYNYMDFYM